LFIRRIRSISVRICLSYAETEGIKLFLVFLNLSVAYEFRSLMLKLTGYRKIFVFIYTSLLAEFTSDKALDCD
jgi:hypothetical protein